MAEGEITPLALETYGPVNPKMNTVLSEILKTGLTVSGDGNETTRVHSSISQEEGEFLQWLIREVDPTISLEVGLAYGVSALFICDALKRQSETKHIVIDPVQRSAWQGIGIANLRRAGYGSIVTLMESPSYRALAELERSGQRIDFAFIDGNHTFDFVLVDFFFIDRMLNIGGMVVLDDANWPSINKVCRFVATNLCYTVVAEHPPTRIPLKYRVLEHLARNWPLRKVMKPEIVVPNEKLGLGVSCVAFRKVSDDRRRWDHFKTF
ncbi:MAG: class I SAM-dependent methyltransferase [Terriglobales bacterium]